MAQILMGTVVAESIIQRSLEQSQLLRSQGTVPALAVVRVGERSDDIAYEKGILKRCRQAETDVRQVIFPEDVSAEDFYAGIEKLNEDPSVHGILIFRPLPGHLDNERARNAIAAEKDVDGSSDSSLTGLFTGSGKGFAPCTAQAVMEILHYYEIPLEGKKATVLGRSLVSGKPVAMLLLQENATVTIAHSRSSDLPSIARQSDILVCCTGKMESVNATYLNPAQTVIDVGISYNEQKGKLCGDVLFEEAERIVSGITPVPRGVGSVTTAVLVSHVVEAASRQH